MTKLQDNSKLTLINAPILIAIENEAAAYTSGTVTNGSGRASGVYVTVQKGTSAEIDVDFTIKTISESTFQDLQQNVKSYVSKDVQHYLDEHYRESNNQSGWFASLFWGASGKGYDHYVNSADKFNGENDNNFEEITKMVHNLETQDFHVKGKLTAVGTSFIPTTVSVYVQISTIQFADGTHISVINTDSPSLADNQGNTSGAAISSGKLNIVPLS